MRIDIENCMSCGQCVDNCKIGAIETVKTHGYARFKINELVCLSCGACKKDCPGECIYDN